MSNQKCQIKSTLINKCSQEFHCYSFAVKLYRGLGSCKAVNDSSNRVYKTENLNLAMFIMIAGINESKILTKDISCKCKCRLMEKGNSDQWWNNDKC